VERKCTTSPNPFSLQGEGDPEFFLVPLSFARRGARGEVFKSFHVTSVLGMSCESLPRRGKLSQLI